MLLGIFAHLNFYKGSHQFPGNPAFPQASPMPQGGTLFSSSMPFALILRRGTRWEKNEELHRGCCSSGSEQVPAGPCSCEAQGSGICRLRQFQALGRPCGEVCEHGSVCVNSNPPSEPSEACLSVTLASNVHPHIKALLTSYQGKQGKTDSRCVLFILTCF